METDIVVRTGTPDDVHKVMDLALACCDEIGLVAPNPTKLVQQIWPSLNLEKGIIGLIGDVGKPLEAMVILRVESQWYSDEDCLSEKAVFVAPEFRKSKGGRASRLCEFANTCAEKLGLPLIIGIMNTHRTEAKVRLYSRIYGAPAGAFWIVGKKTGEWKKDVA